MPVIDTSYLLNGALIAVISVLVGWMLGAMKTGIKSVSRERDKEREQRIAELDALKYGMRELLYDALVALYEKALREGYITPEDYSHMQAVYKAYHALGGNGRGTKIWEEYQELSKKYLLSKVPDMYTKQPVG